MTIPPLPDGDGSDPLRRALRYLRDEMVLVRDGRANGLHVLDDELANVERTLAGGET